MGIIHELRKEKRTDIYNIIFPKQNISSEYLDYNSFDSISLIVILDFTKLLINYAYCKKSLKKILL